MHPATAAAIFIGAAMRPPTTTAAASAPATVAAASTTLTSLPPIPVPYIPPAAVSTIRQRRLATDAVAKR